MTSKQPVVMELLSAAAEQDAEDVAEFLSLIGLESVEGKGLRLPAELLIGLGVAMRLLRWEQLGMREHLQHGLPTAQGAIRLSFLAVSRQDVTKEMIAVLYARYINFLESNVIWINEVPAGDLIGGDIDEDVLVNQLAEYLWAARRTNET